MRKILFMLLGASLHGALFAAVSGTAFVAKVSLGGMLVIFR